MMGERLDQARRYHEAIRHVLLTEWDPIGVADIPAAQDEYDDYVDDIHAMLIRREPRQRVVDYLRWAVRDQMRLFGSRRRIERTADRLLQLPDELA